MSQAQLKEAPVAVTVSCSQCEQEQVVHIRVRTGSWSMAHQSVKCVKCDQYFDVMISDVIIAGPFLPIDTAVSR
jgi:transcription elongation factor Elf1